MQALISKWHRELELFSSLKPLLILNGNVADAYRYPVAGSVGEDEVVPLSAYLNGFFTDKGYEHVVFYSNLVGFMNPYREGAIDRFAKLAGAECKNGAIPAEFKGSTTDTAPNVILRALSQGNASTVIILEESGH